MTKRGKQATREAGARKFGFLEMPLSLIIFATLIAIFRLYQVMENQEKKIPRFHSYLNHTYS